MKAFCLSMVRGVDGETSFKRCFGFAAFIVLVVAVLGAWKGHPIPDHLIDVFAWIFSVCTLGATIDHFATPKPLAPGAAV